VQRRGGGDAFGRDVDLDAELAADVRLFVAHVLPAGRLLEHGEVLVDVDAAPHHDELRVVALTVEEREADLGLEGRLMDHLGVVVAFDDMARLGERPGRVALDLRLGQAQVRPLAVDLRRPLGHRLVRRAEGGQRLVLDPHCGDRRQRLLAGLGGDDRDRIADVAHAVLAEHRPVGDHVVVAVGALDVFRRHDARDTGHSLRRLRVDALDEGVRMRAVHGGKLKGAWGQDVGRELRDAARLDQCGRPRVRHAELRAVRVGTQLIRRLLAAEELTGQLHGLDDLHVPRAATQVVTKSALDLRGRRIGVYVEQGFGGHDHARRAEPALHGARQHERLLDEMRVRRGAQPFDGDDVGAVKLGDLRQARSDRLAVDDDRARAALPLLVAGLLGARQPELVPEQVEEDDIRIDDDLPGDPVERERDLHDTLPPDRVRLGMTAAQGWHDPWRRLQEGDGSTDRPAAPVREERQPAPWEAAGCYEPLRPRDMDKALNPNEPQSTRWPTR